MGKEDEKVYFFLEKSGASYYQLAKGQLLNFQESCESSRWQLEIGHRGCIYTLGVGE